MPISTLPTNIEPLGTRSERRERLDALRTAFEGIDTEYPLADGSTASRTYLDSAASNLRLTVADDIVRRALRHYANTHSELHFGACITTHLYEQAHEIVGEFVDASDDYTVVFNGSGVTGGLNRMARVLAERRPKRDVVITTMMEHHANDLPHRKHVGNVVHVPLEKDPDGETGRVDVSALRSAVREHADRLNYVAVTAASNVTGITNPVHEVARLAHEAGALCVVDAAQSAAHMPFSVQGAGEEEEAIDVLCMSGHKIYAPGSPGVIVARKALFEGLEPQEVGGGIVDRVETGRYEITEALPEREEAGTPNLPGAFRLAATLYLLGRIGMDVIEEDERALTQYALERFEAIDGLKIYGSHRLEVADRIGVITFNLDDLPHGLVTAALNDYFGVAVRNECFCAQPFVRQLLGRAGTGTADDTSDEECGPETQPGMVRVSFGLYNTEADVDTAAEALEDLASRPEWYRARYRPLLDGSGDWIHREFEHDPDRAFSLRREVDDWLREAG